MSFDAWVVGFGISTLLRVLGLVEGPQAYAALAAVVAVDTVLLYRFFARDGGTAALVADPASR
jgi:hypothetical protein